LKSYVPFLSLRYLWYHKVSSGLGILGVALGVGLVIVVVGVMDGFQKRLKSSLIGNTAAVTVEPHFDVDADAFGEAMKKRIPGVVEASPVVYTPSTVSPAEGGIREGVPCTVVGIDAAKENIVSDFAGKLHWGGRRVADDGVTPTTLRLLVSADEAHPFRVGEEEAARNRRVRPEKQGLVIGRGIAGRLRLEVGSLVRLLTARPKPGGKRENSGDLIYETEVFTVTGILESGDSEIDRGLLFMDRRDARSFFREWLTQEADEFRLLLSDPEACDGVKEAIEAASAALVADSLHRNGRVGLDPVKAQTWKDKFQNLLAAVENERGLLIVITSFSFLVVAFLIGSTQSMLVVEKTREIGVLRSLGASVAGTASVFLGNGLFIGVIGASAGAAIGVSITSNIQEIAVGIRGTFGRDLFPADIYRFKEIPIDVQGDFLLSICAGAVIFALLGALLPAVRAAMLDPVESLHHE
jgi:lipoprotein-releasing system permease protein